MKGRTGWAGRGGPYTASDLPMDADGRVYHLQITPEQMAADILIVGDPGRAAMIGTHFLRDVEFTHEHRGLVTVTGTAAVSGERATVISPLRTTVTTSGMGTPSLEVVLNELIALNEIDPATRTRKLAFPRLHILRLGTSGALQEDIVPGIPIITTYAIGMDNTGLYYEASWPDEHCARMEAELGAVVTRAMSPRSRFYGRVQPYVSRAAPAMVKALRDASAQLGVPAKLGLTASCSGFFAPQGRDTARAGLSVPDVDRVLAEYDPQLGGQRIENMEMEASLLLHLTGALGYRAGAFCTTIAQRRKDTFDPHYQEAIQNATRVALLALATLRSRYPDASMS